VQELLDIAHMTQRLIKLYEAVRVRSLPHPRLTTAPPQPRRGTASRVQADHSASSARSSSRASRRLWRTRCATGSNLPRRCITSTTASTT
jgi:hypothetical protein